MTQPERSATAADFRQLLMQRIDDLFDSSSKSEEAVAAMSEAVDSMKTHVAAVNSSLLLINQKVEGLKTTVDRLDLAVDKQAEDFLRVRERTNLVEVAQGKNDVRIASLERLFWVSVTAVITSSLLNLLGL